MAEHTKEDITRLINKNRNILFNNFNILNDELGALIAERAEHKIMLRDFNALNLGYKKVSINFEKKDFTDRIYELDNRIKEKKKEITNVVKDHQDVLRDLNKINGVGFFNRIMNFLRSIFGKENYDNYLKKYDNEVMTLTANNDVAENNPQSEVKINPKHLYNENLAANEILAGNTSLKSKKDLALNLMNSKTYELMEKHRIQTKEFGNLYKEKAKLKELYKNYETMGINECKTVDRSFNKKKLNDLIKKIDEDIFKADDSIKNTKKEYQDIEKDLQKFTKEKRPNHNYYIEKYTKQNNDATPTRKAPPPPIEYENLNRINSCTSSDDGYESGYESGKDNQFVISDFKKSLTRQQHEKLSPVRPAPPLPTPNPPIEKHLPNH